MTRIKPFARTITALLLSAALLFGLFPAAASAASTPVPEVTFTFTDSGITASDASASGFQISGTDLTISAAGTYAVTGSCSEGTITVKKGTTGVTLILENLTLKSSASAPLRCNKETAVTLYVSGTNTLTDAEDAANETSADETVANAFEGAAIKAKAGASLTLTGTGILNLDGSGCKNGLKGGATAAVVVDGSLTLNITAANTGLASDGSVEIRSGTVNITAGNEGIKSEPDEDDTDSAGTVTLSGGTITVSAGDDAVHSTNALTVAGGTITVTAGDDAFHSEYDLIFGVQGAVSGPSVTVKSSYEGFEGARVFLNAGSGTVTASDDGVNAATDMAVSEIAVYVNGGTWYVNAGGDGLDAGGDSRNNSGGNVFLNGGTVEVFGAADNGNSALDFDGACSSNGGTLLAVGMSGMAQTPTSGVYVAFGQSAMGGGFGGWGGSGWQGSAGGSVNITKGSTISIRDAQGNTLYTATGVKSANHVVFASSALTAGSTYTLYVNGSQAATATASTGNGQSGNQPGQPGQGGQQPGQPGGTRPGQGGQQPVQPEQPGQGSVLPFTDVKANAWYYPYVLYVYQNGVMNGMSASVFSPDTALTRAQMVQILYNLEGRPAVSGAAGFADVSSAEWYADAVAWARSSGIVEGYSETLFGPEDTLTRAQAAAILLRYAQYKGQDVTARAALNFSDASAVPDWAVDAMRWCVAKGLMQGSNGALNPTGVATRAEISAIMTRYLSA